MGPGLGPFVQGFLRVGTGSAFAEIAVLREGSLMSQLPGFAESSVSRLLGVVISWVVVWEPSLGPCVRGFGGWMLIAYFFLGPATPQLCRGGATSRLAWPDVPELHWVWSGHFGAILRPQFGWSPQGSGLGGRVGLGCSRQVFQSPQDPH